MSVNSAKDIYSLSEEEFNKLTPDELRAHAEASDEEDENPNDVEEDENSNGDEGDDESSAEENSEDTTSTDEDESDEDEDGANPESESASNETLDSAETRKDKPKPDAKKVKNKELTEPGIETKVTPESALAFHSAVTAPLKADGTSYNFEDPDTIRQLIQKGINYNSKMESIKELRGISSILSENDLLDPSKLSFLIDLKNHKPEAIAKLLQESNLDAYELDEDKARSYQNVPVDIKASSASAHFQSVYNDNSSNPNFTRVFKEADKWDEPSQRVLTQKPEHLVTLADHVESGVYDKIMSTVMYERTVGEVNIPMLDHYHNVGVRLFGNGNSNGGGNAQVPNNNTTTPNNSVPNNVMVKKKVVSPDVQAMRNKVAGTTKATKRVSKQPAIKNASDIFKLSDDEFKKIDPTLLRNIGK